MGVEPGSPPKSPTGAESGRSSLPPPQTPSSPWPGDQSLTGERFDLPDENGRLALAATLNDDASIDIAQEVARLQQHVSTATALARRVCAYVHEYVCAHPF